MGCDAFPALQVALRDPLAGFLLQVLLCGMSVVHLFPVSVGMFRVLSGLLCAAVWELLVSKEHLAVSVDVDQTDDMKLITNTLVPCLAIALHWGRFTVVSDLAAAASTQSSSSWSYSAKFHTCTAANPGDSLDLKGMMADLHQGNRSMFELFASIFYITHCSPRSQVYKSKLASLGFVTMGN